MRYPRKPGLVPTSTGSFGPYIYEYVIFYDRGTARDLRGLCWVRDIIPGQSAVVVSVRCAEHVGPGLKHCFDWKLIGIR
jgi:hypothetical protein